MIVFIAFLILFIWIVILQLNFNDFKERVEIFFKGLPNQELGNIAQKTPKRQFASNLQQIESKMESLPEIPQNEPVLEEDHMSQPEQPKPDLNFETFFMENIFNKLGAVAVVVGIGFFIKLISPFFVLTPPVQIVAGFLAGLLMIFGSVYLHKGEMKNYAEVLMGAGVAVLFVATYCGYSLYHLISMEIATVIGVLLILATYFIAQKYNSFSTLAIGLVGGYLNPFFCNSDVTTTFLFSYLIFINLISIVYVYHNKNKIALSCTNLILTTLTISIFAATKESINIILPLLLWAAYVINDLINTKDEYKDVNSLLNWLNFGALIWFVNYVFQFQQKLLVGGIILVAGIVYAICAAALARSSNNTTAVSRHYFQGALLSVLIATYFISDNTLRTAVWGIEALIVAFVAKTYNQKFLTNWSFAFLSISLTSIFFNPNAIWLQDVQSYKPVLNERTVLFGIPTFCALVASHLLSGLDKKVSDLCKFLGLSFIYLFVIFELNAILSKFNFGATKYGIGYSLKCICYAIIGFIYALNMKRLYNSTNLQLFNSASYIIFGISLLMTLFFGWMNLPIGAFFPVFNLRSVAFILAVAVSLYYSKFEKNAFFQYLAIVLGGLAISCEAQDILGLTYVFSNILFTTIWIVYSGIIMLIGTFKNVKPLKLAGIWITIIAVLKILFSDLASVDAIFKLIAFLSLGVILMIVSYFYAKRKELS